MENESQSDTPEKVIHKQMRLYHRGIICPTAAWNVIGDVLKSAARCGCDVNLPTKTIELLRRCNQERPESFEWVAENIPALQELRPLLREEIPPPI